MQTVEGKKRLERNGHYHFGEPILKFIPGGLNDQDTQESPTFEPEHLFFTSSGRIGVIAHVSDDVALDLTSVQNNLAASITGPGDVHHSKYVVVSSIQECY